MKVGEITSVVTTTEPDNTFVILILSTDRLIKFAIPILKVTLSNSCKLVSIVVSNTVEKA